MKVLFSVGGWTAGGWVFSQMAETAERRRMFTASVLHFLGYFGLDGMDLDWEMPGYDMYGGQPTNPEVCELLMFLGLNKANKRYTYDRSIASMTSYGIYGIYIWGIFHTSDQHNQE